jgi:hypothetical protein
MDKKIEDINVVDAEVLDFTYPLLKVDSVEVFVNGKLQENYQGIQEMAISYVDNGAKLKLMIKQ